MHKQLPFAPISFARKVLPAQSDGHDTDSSLESQMELGQSPTGCLVGIAVVGVGMGLADGERVVGIPWITSYLHGKQINKLWMIDPIRKFCQFHYLSSTHLIMPAKTRPAMTFSATLPPANKPPVTPLPSYISKSLFSEYNDEGESVPTSYNNRVGVNR